MTKRSKVLFASLLFAGTMGFSFSAAAEEDSFLGGVFSANVAMMNDYRFRGVSLNDEGFAVQGGLDWSSDSGFYVGTWASNIADFNGSTVETDFYAGYAGEAGAINYDIGGLLYNYPGGTATNYFEAYGSVGTDLGFLAVTFGANYAFSSDNLGNGDNIYLYTDGAVAIPDTPFTVNLRLGYEDGSLANDKLDWQVGTSVTFKGLDFTLTYIDTNIAGDNSDATVVFSVGASF